MPAVLLTLTPRDSPPESDTDASTNTSIAESTRVWIILAAVAALLTLGACTALVVISYSKRRLLKQQLDETRRRDSGLAWEKPTTRKRKMTAEDLEMEAESTRTAMIRKSLASRSGRTGSFATSHRTSSTADRPGSSSGEGLPAYDWKDFEAGISRHSSLATLRRSTPSPLPELPAPAVSRSSSPSRNPLLAGRAELPPPLEQHPCLRS